MTEPEEDFAAMFEASLQAKRFERGDTIEGTIVAIGPEVAFVNVGGKGEATIEIDELKDADGALEVAVGDRIQAMVVSTEGGLKLSRKLARGAATSQQLEDAFHAGLPVEGKVERAVKGGYEVRIAGQRAFCPFSQIDIVRNTTRRSTTGTSTRSGSSSTRRAARTSSSRGARCSKRNSRREPPRSAQSIVAGAVLTGRVASVRDFGAFVDLGAGIQGLLHVSEMGWSRVCGPVAASSRPARRSRSRCCASTTTGRRSRSG